jgi:hypothetical protein
VVAHRWHIGDCISVTVHSLQHYVNDHLKLLSERSSQIPHPVSS